MLEVSPLIDRKKSCENETKPVSFKISEKMDLTVVSSKFALLPDDDEDLNKKALRNKVLGKEIKDQRPRKNSEDERGQNKSAKSKKKKNKKTKKSNENSTEKSDEQFANWLSRDQIATDESFAQDLQAAILASKVQFDMEAKCREEIHLAKASRKPAKMTLQEFNNLSIREENRMKEGANPVIEDNFFEDVEEATKRALNREQIKESLQQRYNHLPDHALVKQYRSILESKDEEMAKLTEDNQKLAQELDKIKKRYKQFRELLDQVECRNKAEIISENIKLKKVQEEISEEMSSIREENEKLKSKVALLEKINARNHR